MLTGIHPKLPMRNRKRTIEYYMNLGFKKFGEAEYPDYLMLEKDQVQIHFFKFIDLNPKENYGQVYIRTSNIDHLYQFFLDRKVNIHPNGNLQIKTWGQREFYLLDPDNNLLTFGQSI